MILIDLEAIDNYIYILDDKVVSNTKGHFICLSEIVSNREYGLKPGDKHYIDPYVDHVGQCNWCRKILYTNNPDIPIDIFKISKDMNFKKLVEVLNRHYKENQKP